MKPPPDNLPDLVGKWLCLRCHVAGFAQPINYCVHLVKLHFMRTKIVLEVDGGPGSLSWGIEWRNVVDVQEAEVTARKG